MRPPRTVSGPEAARLGWLAPRPECYRCGVPFERAASSKDGVPGYVGHEPECPACFRLRVAGRAEKKP